MKIKSELNKQNLPIFVLFKNLQFNEGAISIDIDQIKSGEIKACAPYESELEKYIPPSVYPKSPDKQQKFTDKYGDREDVDSSFNTSPFAMIDIDPEDLESTTDFDIFGESYTILWVCSNNVDETVNTLIQHTIKLADSRQSTIGDQITNIWIYYIDCISINSDDKDFDSLDFDFIVKEEYKNQISKLPNAPTQADWDYLDEMSMK